MAKGFDTLHIKSAVKAHNKMDLSFTHLTTMDFGEVVPLLSTELVPGDKFSVKGNYFSRMAPLAKPTFGKFAFKTMTAFVPYFQVADDAEAWLSGKKQWEGSTTILRKIPYVEYANFLENIGTSVLIQTSGGSIYSKCDTSYYTDFPTALSGTNVSATVNADGTVTYKGTAAANSAVTYTLAYDWTTTDNSGNVLFYAFHNENKYYVKVLNALGYALPTNVDFRTGSTWYQKYGNPTPTAPEKYLNAMPLLCFAKAYNDYMSQSQAWNTSQLTAFLRAVKEDKTQSGYVSGYNGYIDASGIEKLLKFIRVQYENDYFTSAWQSPNRPISSNAENLDSVVAPRANGSSNVTISQNENNVYFQSSAVSSLSQRTLDFLKSFDDWVRRNNYSGSRAVQAIYSKFGIKTEDFRSNYAHVITTDTIPVSVGDVTATADVNVPLGDYAGKGIMNGEKGFSFDSNDYGMLFVFGWYSVLPMNAYGFDRTVLKTTPLEFYNAEFDGLGADAISAGEFFTNPIAKSNGDNTIDSAVFGYTERYNDYRFGRDRITGDFRKYSPDSDMNVWHTGRLLGDIRANNQLFAQFPQINSMAIDDSEFNRIFSVVKGDENHFYMTAQFSVSAVRPMLSLNQTPRLGEGDTTIARGGNEIS